MAAAGQEDGAWQSASKVSDLLVLGAPRFPCEIV